MEINFTTALPGGVEPKNGKYHCKVAHNRVIAPDEVAEDMAKKLHIDPLQAQLYLANVMPTSSAAWRRANQSTSALSPYIYP